MNVNYLLIASLFMIIQGCSIGSSPNNNKSNKENSNKELIQQGKEIALSAKKELGSNLVKAIQEKGVPGAVSFCSEKALVLTDSVAEAHNAEIKRVSDKNRNPLNAANKDELVYIGKAKDLLASGTQPKPEMHVRNGKHVGYYPIITNAMCLNCHGAPKKDITIETLETIDSNYPNDLAKGYEANELRGIWVVEF